MSAARQFAHKTPLFHSLLYVVLYRYYQEHREKIIEQQGIVNKEAYAAYHRRYRAAKKGMLAKQRELTAGGGKPAEPGTEIKQGRPN